MNHLRLQGLHQVIGGAVKHGRSAFCFRQRAGRILWPGSLAGRLAEPVCRSADALIGLAWALLFAILRRYVLLAHLHP